MERLCTLGCTLCCGAARQCAWDCAGSDFCHHPPGDLHNMVPRLRFLPGDGVVEIFMMLDLLLLSSMSLLNYFGRRLHPSVSP